PIFCVTAAYGHMGREPYKDKLDVYYVEVQEDKNTKKEIRKKTKKEVEFFTWEKLDYVEQIKKAFGIKK
ncbi:MAG: methionine adenosyltransferase, partial [Raineya sp.]